ncbi:MAG: heme-binding protein [Eubacteriales bacterium]|nr:heme-binding protein [Eubacteriales bacterium]
MKQIDQTAHELNLKLKAQEDATIFESFSRADALSLGLKMLDAAKHYPDPVAVEIVINGLVVFRHFTDGSVLDSEMWLLRKRNSVELMAMSSLRFNAWLSEGGRTLESRHLNSELYAACGGGFPILLKNTGMIGSICISGLPSDLDDHQVILDALQAFRAV